MSTLHILFQVADSQYAIPAALVLHVESFSGATPVPGASPWIAGVMQVRRRVIPVADLRRRFGLDPIDPTLDSRVVVVEAQGRTVGLLVDRAREVAHLDTDQIQAPPEVVAREARGFVRAIARAGERLVLLLDVERVIGEGVLHGKPGE